MFSFFKKKRTEFIHMYHNLDIKLELIYESAKGYKFYTYAHPIQVPYKRTEMALLYSRYASMGITRARLYEYIDAIIQANNKSDTSLIGALANQLKAVEEMTAERKVLQDLATVYTVLEGEPATRFVESWQDKKRDIWQDDEDCRDFFLSWAYGKIADLTKIQADTILKRSRELASAREIMDLTLRKKSQDSSKKETESHSTSRGKSKRVLPK
jgi:hypothetical protein